VAISPVQKAPIERLVDMLAATTAMATLYKTGWETTTLQSSMKI